MTNKTKILVALATLAALIGCGEPPPLTEAFATALITERTVDEEPIYAEVPRKVWWGPDFPKDDYDELAVRTLQNLEDEGMITLTHTVEGEVETWLADVTDKGFPILGTVPSYRGKALRAKICVKEIEGVRNFIQHPNNPHVGSADLVWRYAKPTPLYEAFETRINKPLDHPFKSVVSIHNDKGVWRLDLIIKKADLESGAVVDDTDSSEKVDASEEETAEEDGAADKGAN